MRLVPFGKAAATLVLAGALAGCIDASVDVEITSATTARAVLTQEMSADFYAMVKMNAEKEPAATNEFCQEGELVENADGSATCTITEEGRFADLTLTDGPDAMIITSAGPGLVRVSLPTAEMREELGANEDLDEETRQMVETFFTGHALTIRLSGAEIIETNLDPADDANTVEKVLPFIDLINGSANLPDELYAVVRAP